MGKWPTESTDGRLNALKQRPLRALKGSPIINKGGLKPFKKPEGPVKTLPLVIRKTKPLRGVTR